MMQDQFAQNYAPVGNWLWDPWFLKQEDTVHLFHLQTAPISNPDDRHHNAISIGHAVAQSTNLQNWTTLQVALSPGDQGAWDDAALWTGSVLQANHQYYLFYTGLSNSKSEYWVQRIGMAKANDDGLIEWTKQNMPILEADNHYYHMSNNKNVLGVIPAFRDPYAFEHDNIYYLAFTARAVGQLPPYNACIGLAKSNNLEQWQLLPPLLAPQKYDEMEVPQVIYYQDKWYLFFTTAAKYISHPWARELEGQTITSCYMADSLTGKYKPANGNGVVYASKLVRGLRLMQQQNDSFVAIGWLDLDSRNQFIGRLSDPLTVYIDGYNIKIE